MESEENFDEEEVECEILEVYQDGDNYIISDASSIHDYCKSSEKGNNTSCKTEEEANLDCEIITEGETEVIPDLSGGLSAKDLWTPSNIRLLLDSRYHCNNYFNHKIPRTRYERPWSKVLSKMRQHNPNFPGTELEISNKFRSMSYTYRQNSKNSNSFVSWAWYEDMDRIFVESKIPTEKSKIAAQKKASLPLDQLLRGAISSTLVIPNQKTGNETAQITKLAKIVNVETPKTVNLGGKVSQKRAKGIRSGKKKLWNYKNTKLLIEFRKQNDKLFKCNDKKSFKDKWKYIHKLIVSEDPSFGGTYVSCAEKWKNIVSYYLLNLTNSQKDFKSDWIWFDEIDSFLGHRTFEDVTEPLCTPNFDETTSYITTKIEDPDFDDTGNKSYDLPVEFGEGWTHDHIQILLEATRECCDAFSGDGANSISLWGTVKERVSSFDPNFNPSVFNCQSAWKSLKSAYQLNKAKEQIRGRDSVSWIWYDEMDGIFDICPQLFYFDEECEDADGNNEQALWTERNVKLLLFCRMKYGECFKDKTVRFPWRNILEKMLEIDPNFPASSLACSFKWRNMKAVYRKMKGEEREVGWQWYHSFDQYYTNGVHPDYFYVLEDDQAYIDELWSMRNIELLVFCRILNDQHFGHLPLRRAWSIVNKKMVEVDPNLRGACLNIATKWKKLMHTYIFHKQRGSVLTWNWFKMVNLFVSDKDSSQDPLQLAALLDNAELWTDANTELLIKCLEICKDYFVDASYEPWEQVRLKIVESQPNFKGTAEDCYNKARLLRMALCFVKGQDRLPSTHPVWKWFKALFHKKDESDDPALLVAAAEELEKETIDEEETQLEINQEGEVVPKKLQSVVDNGWFKNYLIRKEQRDMAAEVREERTLSLLERFVSLEEKKFQASCQKMKSP